MTRNALPESTMPMVPPRVLLGPGPSNASPRVLQAMMAPMIGYLDPDFMEIVEEVSHLLKIVFTTEEAITMAIAGTGSAGMEAGVSSLLEPGDTAILGVCGFFGERMYDMAQRVGANVVILRSEWGKPFPAEMMEAELKRHKQVKLIATVHAETSTGVQQPLGDISRLAKQYGTLFMVDAVTSLGGTKVTVDAEGIDYCYSASQKCLGCPPGMSPVALSQRGRQAIKNRKQKPASWYLDLDLIARYWGPERTYHHTAPVSMILGLREALRMLVEEGVDNRIARHKRNAAALRAGVQALGLKLVVPEPHRLDQITPLWIPQGVDDGKVRNALLREYNIEIGRGLGQFSGKVWRIGLMGESSKSEYVLALLSALENILPRCGYEVPVGAGVSAASASLAAAAGAR
ncbi:MAG: alanine--glyoxylate aminotransferase family protein [SAR202 cluster bacterium]|nr:alanine--glyoxylate aminotransferase family protein [SAR202 cluster bacterium]